ncbi:MAG: nitrate reductase molybdenum cofactor assembly chaperone [Alphaproteobacteria bacterium]|nr:MAG: nitrate reductase molybdenum cofactor assembly chaperone [Alphaproteobacteria bacterium]
MMKTFKLLGLLLSYPSAELQAHMDEIKVALDQEGLVPARVRRPLFAFLDSLSRRALVKVQEDYVGLFDRSRAHSLYLFEHVHGESRDRGQAMVDLMDLYRRHGFTLSARELPDYLPLFLEFLSQVPVAEAQELLGETVHILAAVGAKLKAKDSGYAHVFAALEGLTDAKVDPRYVEQAAEEVEDTSFEALDKAWEETPAFDGTGTAAACGVCPQATRHAPAPGATGQA